MARNDINLGMSIKEILKKINEEDIYILEISSDGGSLTETQFTQFKENFPYVSILLWYAGYQYLITNIQEYSYTDEGGVNKSYVGDITVNDAELRVTINENGTWTAQPFIPASKQISDISVGKRTLQKISLGRKNDNEGVSIITEEIDEAGSISYEVNEDNSQSLILTSEHVIEFKGNVDFSNANVTGLPNSGSGEIPDNVAIYEGSTNDSEIILSNASVANGIKTSGIKIVPSGKDGQNVSNITYSDQEVPTSKNVRWALNEFGQNFAAADFSSSKFNQNEVIIGGEHLANLYAVKGSGAYFTNSSSFTANGKPIDDTHIPTTKVVKTIVDDAILSSGGSSNGDEPLSIEVDELPTENIDDSKIYVLSVIENKEVYYHFEGGYFTLKDLVATTQGIQADITYYVVKELPTSPLTTNLATFSIVHCYIYNDIAYVYGNAGYGNMWLTVSTLVSQISGITVIDKGRTPNIATENNDIAMYVYYEDYKKFYLYSNEQWVEITDSKSNTYILSLSGTSGTLTDEQYQAIKDNFPNVIVLYTEQYSDAIGTLVMPIIGVVNGAYIATSTTNLAVSDIIIYSTKEWNFQEYNFKDYYVTINSIQEISGDKTFNGKATFNGAVDFTNANITGLQSGGIDILPASIKYDNDTNILIINSPDNLQIETFNGDTTLLGRTFSLNSETENGDISKIHCGEGAIEIESDNGIKFYGNVDFTDATVTGLPLNGGSIDTTANITWEGDHIFANRVNFIDTVDFTHATVIGLPTSGSSDVNTQDDITWEGDQKFNGNVQFFADCGMDYINCDTEAKFNGDAYFYGLVNFSNGEVTFNNGLVAKGNVDFSNATVTGLPTSSGGLDIPSEVINYDSENNSLSFNSNSLSLSSKFLNFEANAFENSAISFIVGLNDQTGMYASSDTLNFFANEGVINFTGRDGIYYSSPQHNFSGNVSFDSDVDFSNATVIGLPSGGSSDLTELKRVMRLLHAEKYTQSIQATKFTSTPMGSIHKIEKPSNGLLEASEYVLYSVDFEDAPAYLNATITIGNNGLINDSGTFSFTLQGRSIAAGQNINVICVFVPLAFL